MVTCTLVAAYCLVLLCGIAFQKMSLGTPGKEGEFWDEKCWEQHKSAFIQLYTCVITHMNTVISFSIYLFYSFIYTYLFIWNIFRSIYLQIRCHHTRLNFLVQTVLKNEWSFLFMEWQKGFLKLFMKSLRTGKNDQIKVFRNSENELMAYKNLRRMYWSKADESPFPSPWNPALYRCEKFLVTIALSVGYFQRTIVGSVRWLTRKAAQLGIAFTWPVSKGTLTLEAGGLTYTVPGLDPNTETQNS